jgi:antitoxin PrlF
MHLRARTEVPVRSELHYDFRIDGQDVGGYIIEDDGTEIRQWVRFHTEDGDRFENQYLVRYSGDRVLAYKMGDDDWVDCSEPEKHYPTAAYPLLVRYRIESYMAIDEETGEVRPRSLEYTGDRVIERQGHETVRTFEFRDGIVWKTGVARPRPSGPTSLEARLAICMSPARRVFSHAPAPAPRKPTLSSRPCGTLPYHHRCRKEGSRVDVPATVTTKGQVTIPKPVREALGIEAGDEVIFRIYEDRAVIAKVPDFLDLAGSVPVPADKSGMDWSKIKAVTWRKRAATRR